MKKKGKKEKGPTGIPKSVDAEREENNAEEVGPSACAFADENENIRITWCVLYNGILLGGNGWMEILDRLIFFTFFPSISLIKSLKIDHLMWKSLFFIDFSF